MADQLAEIRRKVATLAAGMKPPLWSPGAEYARDVPYLLAEVDRLSAAVADAVDHLEIDRWDYDWPDAASGIAADLRKLIEPAS
jgi:hypothetical protein